MRSKGNDACPNRDESYWSHDVLAIGSVRGPSKSVTLVQRRYLEPTCAESKFPDRAYDEQGLNLVVPNAH